MNFLGISTFSLIAVVVFSVSIPTTHAFFHNWEEIKSDITVAAPVAKKCKHHSDCPEIEKCHKKVCVSGCREKDCDSSAMCRVKNHHHECFCGFCYKLVDKKCEFDLPSCHRGWPFW